MLIPAQRCVTVGERNVEHTPRSEPTRVAEGNTIRASTCAQLALPSLLSTRKLGFDNGVATKRSAVARIEA